MKGLGGGQGAGREQPWGGWVQLLSPPPPPPNPGSPPGHGPLGHPIGAADDRLRRLLHGPADLAGDLRCFLEVTRGQLGTPRVRGGHLGCETMWGGGGEGGHSVSKGLASMWLNATWREENNPGWERCPGCLAPSPTWESTRPPAAPRGGDVGQAGTPAPRCSCPQVHQIGALHHPAQFLCLHPGLQHPHPRGPVSDAQQGGCHHRTPLMGVPGVGAGAAVESKPSFPGRSPHPCWLPAADWIWINSISGLNPLRRWF